MGQAESTEGAPLTATAPHKAASRNQEKRASTASTASSASADAGDERSQRYGRDATATETAAADAYPHKAGSTGSPGSTATLGSEATGRDVTLHLSVSALSHFLEGTTLEQQQQQHRRQQQLQQKQRQQQKQQQEGQQQTTDEEGNILDSYVSLGFTGLKRLFSGTVFEAGSVEAAHPDKAEPAAAGAAGAAEAAATRAGGVDVPEQEPEQPFIVPTRKLSHGKNPALAAMRREPKRGAAAPAAAAPAASTASTATPAGATAAPAATPHPQAALAAGMAQGAAAKKAAEEMAASMRGQGRHSEEDLHAHREAAFASAARQEQSDLLREERRKSSEARLAKEAAAMFDSLKREEEREGRAPERQQAGAAEKQHADTAETRFSETPTAIGEARDVGLTEACRSEQEIEREEGPEISLGDIPAPVKDEAFPRDAEAYKAHRPPAGGHGGVSRHEAASRSAEAEDERPRGGRLTKKDADTRGDAEGERPEAKASLAEEGDNFGEASREHESKKMKETSSDLRELKEEDSGDRQGKKTLHEQHEAAPHSVEHTKKGLDKSLHGKKGNQVKERKGEREEIKPQGQQEPLDLVPPQPQQETTSFSHETRQEGMHQAHQRGKGEESRAAAGGDGHHRPDVEVEAGDDDPSLRTRHTLSRELSEGGLDRMLHKVREGSASEGAREQQWEPRDQQREQQLHAGGEQRDEAAPGGLRESRGDDVEGTIPIAPWPEATGMQIDRGQGPYSSKAEEALGQDARSGAPRQGLKEAEASGSHAHGGGAPRDLKGSRQQAAHPLSRELTKEELHELLRERQDQEARTARRPGGAGDWEQDDKPSSSADEESEASRHHQQHAVGRQTKAGHAEPHEQGGTAGRDKGGNAGLTLREKHFGEAHGEQQAVPLSREIDNEELRESLKEAGPEHAGGAVAGEVREGGKQQGHPAGEGSRRLHEAEPLSREISKEELHELVDQIKADMRGDEQKEGRVVEGGRVDEAARRPHAEEEIIRDLQHAQKSTPLSREQSKKGMTEKPLRKRPSAGATIVMEVAPGSGGTKPATAFGTTVHVVTTKKTDPLLASIDPEGVLTKAVTQHPSSSTSASSARQHYTAPGERAASSGSHVPLSRGMSHATNAPTNPPALPSKLGSKK
ncbi:hypothetical protein Emag_007777 [Eimeria magna]